MLQQKKRWHMEREQRSLIDYWWDKLQPLVRKFVKETFISGFDEEDIRQECFLQLHKALQRYDEGLGISFAYYYKVVLCGWRANENKKNRGCEISYDEEILVFLIDNDRTNVEYDIERKMLLEEVKKLIEALEARERQIILAYYLENKKLKDIAVELGLSYKKTQHIKDRAIHKLSIIFQRDI